ncbi:hypothetical protein QNM97_10395 [Gordonia sp. L191]|uniref:hypothetical protein n=1 Tax=Gordonia sp. L191 TaxID=2982699 RepID=UPI0024C046B7|nr:hypothetical protein [Gordonia sp. L191]WHU49343.1 hypothetical protein QNM97_10395 [Gordonia sp. L191]
MTERPKDQSGNPRLTFSEIAYLVLFIVLLISAIGDAITNHVGIFNILVFILAPVGIAIIVIRKVGKR